MSSDKNLYMGNAKDTRGSCDVIYERLRSNVEKLAVGTRLCSIREVAKKYKVSYPTAQRAVKMLQHKGLVFSKRGAGTYTQEQPSSKPHSPEQGQQSTIETVATRKDTETRSLLVIIPSEANERQAASMHQYVLGVLAQAKKHRWRVEIEGVRFGETGDLDFSDRIIKHGFNAVIWPQVLPGDQVNIVRLKDHGAELVLGRRMPDIRSKGIHEDYSYVAEKIIRYSISKGLKNVVFLGGPIEKTIWCTQDNESVDFVQALEKAEKEHGLDFSEDRVCQAWGLPGTDGIVTNFIKAHPDANVIISMYFPLLATVAKMKNDNNINPESMLAVDITGDILGFWDHHEKLLTVGTLPTLRVEAPMYELGRAAVIELERKWLEKASEDRFEFKSKIIAPDGSILS
jgi:DNA-binding transcriptional regulator YhcF (GntR family)